MKYILTIAFAFFIFTGNVKAAPLHAYYCFNALETANKIEPTIPGKAAGKITLIIVSDLVVPSAYEPSLSL